MFIIPNVDNATLLDILIKLDACEASTEHVISSGSDVRGLMDTLKYSQHFWLYFLAERLSGNFGFPSFNELRLAIQPIMEGLESKRKVVHARFFPIFEANWSEFYADVNLVSREIVIEKNRGVYDQMKPELDALDAEYINQIRGLFKVEDREFTEEEKRWLSNV